jgi:hypothetical protein
MEKVITILVFAGFVLALLLCLVAVVGGIWLAFAAYRSRRRTKDEATFEHPKSGWKVHIKAAGGIILSIAGLVGCCFIVYHYWQALLGVLVILGAGGGEVSRQKPKKKAVRKKIAKKKVPKKKHYR